MPDSRLGESEVSCAWNAQALLGEGPVWHPEYSSLCFVDIKGHRVLRYGPGGGQIAVQLAEEVGCIAFRGDNGLVAALRSGIAFVDLADGSFKTVANPERHLPGNRFNDGKCDRRGRFWVGSMDADESRPTGALYRMAPDFSISRVVHGFVVTNGIGWSPDDKVMYVTDSANREILAFDFDLASGSPSARRVFAKVKLDSGYPDGLTVDAEGFVWSAHWDGWRVTRYRPDGRVDRVIELPVPRPTSCAFGGALLDRLFVTSARVGLSRAELEAAPLSGALFEVVAGVRGLTEPRFGG